MSLNCFLKALTQKYIILIKNVHLEKGLVACNILNSLINIILQFTAFDAFILFCPLNSTKKLMILHLKMHYILIFLHIKPW